MSDFLVHLVNFSTLVFCAMFFLGALAWFIRPGGVPLLTLLSAREQGLRNARKELENGDWQAAFTSAGQLRNPKRPDPRFERRIRNFEGDCLYRAAELALQGRRYAEALELMRGAGDRLGLPETEFDKRIEQLLLAELRRRIATDPTANEIRRLGQEVMRVRPEHPEASFWLGIHHLHAGRKDSAREILHDAIIDANVPDGALYLGVLLMQLGEDFDAFQCLRQAAHLAPECPVILAYYGAAIIANNGDAASAVRALEKATSVDGLGKLSRSKEDVWAALGPKSWMSALSRRASISCPLGLDKIDEMMAMARRSLAVALERCDRATDAASVYYQSFSAGDHSLEVRRGLGLSLARTELYDDALPHLQAAYERENPPSAALIGNLALTLTKVGASKPQDQARNIQQALNVLTAIDVRHDAEWARLARVVVGEAKKADVDLTSAHRLSLARAFAAADARDAIAIETFDRLGAEADTLPLDVAAAYVRAAAESNVCGTNDEALFNRAFKEREGLKRHFADHKWDFAAVERLYLVRWVQRHPGRYPDAPGPLYAAIAERILTDEWRKHMAEGRHEEGRAALDLAFRLGPVRALTLDRLAEQADRRGDREDVLQYLETWAKHHPHDPRPLVRRAMLDRRDGKSVAALERLTDACGIANGTQRSKLLLITVRVALEARQFEAAEELFEQARQLAPQDPVPTIGLAAMALKRSDHERLASLAPLFTENGANEPLKSLLAAVSFALAGDEAASVVELAVAAEDNSLAADVQYLRTAILVWHGQTEEARKEIDCIQKNSGHSREAVLALQGILAWKSFDYADALLAWGEIPSTRRAQWNLDRHLAAAAFLFGAGELNEQRPAEAVEWFRQAREYGLKNDRLAIMEAVARQQLNQPAPSDAEQLRMLEAAVPADTRSPMTTAWLARSYRRGGDLANARRLLQDELPAHGIVELQKALVELQDNQLAEAEKHLVVARDLSPDTLAIEYNLAFTRLVLDHGDEAAEGFDRAAELHPNPEAKRILSLLAAIAPKAVRKEILGSMTPVDEQRLIKRIQQIGRVDAVLSLLQTLAQSRWQSGAVAQALTEAYVLWTRTVLDRGEPESAMAAAAKWPAAPARPLGNLLGVAAALTGNIDQALAYFQAALPTAEDDARVQQNLALATLRLGDRGRARHHWKRFLASQPAHCPAPPGDPNYLFRVGEIVRARLSDMPAEVAA